MEDDDTEKYHPSRVIQVFVFLSRKRGCIRCISLQVYNKCIYAKLLTIISIGNTYLRMSLIHFIMTAHTGALMQRVSTQMKCCMLKCMGKSVS